jgi:hypothetical protein
LRIFSRNFKKIVLYYIKRKENYFLFAKKLRKGKIIMAKVKTTAPEVTAAVNSAEGVAPKKEKNKAATAYEVISLPSNRDRLSPQLRALVDVIDESKEEIGGKQIVARAIILAKWTNKVGSESGDKVFASYMHQLLSFAFLDRIGTSATPKKVISPMERKQKLMDMLAKLPEADRKELLASMGA